MKHLTLAFMVVALIGATQTATAHCQIPCGIYGDDARFTEMLEHVTTIRKSINQINTLNAEKDKNINQIVRWVNNKEAHADKISEIVHTYFLAQRIKSSQDKYTEKLAALHEIIVLSMKAKQGSDPATADKLESAIGAFKTLYTAKK